MKHLVHLKYVTFVKKIYFTEHKHTKCDASVPTSFGYE